MAWFRLENTHTHDFYDSGGLPDCFLYTETWIDSSFVNESIFEIGDTKLITIFQKFNNKKAKHLLYIKISQDCDKFTNVINFVRLHFTANGNDLAKHTHTERVYSFVKNHIEDMVKCDVCRFAWKWRKNRGRKKERRLVCKKKIIETTNKQTSEKIEIKCSKNQLQYLF